MNYYHWLGFDGMGIEDRLALSGDILAMHKRDCDGMGWRKATALLRTRAKRLGLI